MPAAALRGALPAAALRAGALPAVAAVPTPPACDRRMPSTRRTSSRPSAWTLCAAPRPSPRCGARSERGVLACAPSEKSHRGDRREAGQVPAGARARHAPLTCPRRAPTATARAAASAGPLASSAHGCRLLLRAAVGHCRAGALPDDHEQLLPREPGHHDRVRRDRPPVRALGAPCLAAAALPLRVIPLADLSTTWTTGSSRSTSTPIPTCRRCAHHNSERLLRCRLTAVLPAVCVCVACSCSWGTRAT